MNLVFGLLWIFKVDTVDLQQGKIPFPVTGTANFTFYGISSA